jgi:hypothetical protein
MAEKRNKTEVNKSGVLKSCFGKKDFRELEKLLNDVYGSRSLSIDLNIIINK